MGILYSRSIGALSAKGDYIFPIDNDDLFLDKDVFSIVSNVAIRGNFDIVEFKGINTFQYGSSISRNIKIISICGRNVIIIRKRKNNRWEENK